MPHNLICIKLKKKITSLIIICLILSIPWCIESSDGVEIRINNISPLTNHNPIHIIGNSQFIALNGVTKGSGIFSDPFIIDNWKINASIDHGIVIENTNVYFEILNCQILNGNLNVTKNKGIIFKNVENGTIDNCSLSNNYLGIQFENSNINYIENNSFEYNNWTIRFEKESKMNIVKNNLINSTVQSSINIIGGSNFNIIEQNNITFDGSGVSISASFYNILKFNTFLHYKEPYWKLTGHGISISQANNNEVQNNSFLYYQQSIILNRADLNKIVNNKCIKSEKGILLIRSKNNIIRNNSISKNLDGLLLGDKANNNFIFNNIITKNRYAGINLSAYYYVSLSPCINNTLFNNFFNNSINFVEDNECISIWNISKTPGKNIINGTYLGGNFWSDYFGRDTNGDGLGDTLTPYGHGDYLPLVDLIKPGISDNTTGIPTTGDEFVFKAKAWDDLLLRNVNVNFWYDSGPGDNFSMNLTKGNYQNATYMQTINVSSNATKMFYNLSITDTGSNWANTSTMTLMVIDNDFPDIRDITTSIPKTGDEFIVKTIINDNIELSDTYVEYRFNNQIKYNESLDYFINSYHKTINIPSWATKVSYKISAEDTSNNWANLQKKIINVTDDKKPTIIDNSGMPTTGDEYNFVFNSSDNIEIVSKTLEYWIDNDSHENISINDENSYHITIPKNAYLLNYLITVIDSSNNLFQISESKPVIDNDLPIIIDNTSGKPETNDTFTIEFSIIENRDVGNITLNYWYDGQNKFDKSFIIDSYGSYNHSIQIPIDKRDLNYEIIVSDLSNNTARSENVISIIDTIQPVITDLTNGTPTTGDEFNISVNVTENIEIDTFFIEYWFDDKPLPKTSNQVMTKIFVPSTSKFLFYIATARDLAGNMHNIANELIVIDNDQPEIIINNNTPTTGDRFEMEIIIRDNINISISYLLFSAKNNMNYSNISLEPCINTYSIILPNNSRTLRYNIIAVDGSNNSFSINKTVNVIDNDSPIVDDYSPKSGTTGDLYVLNLKLSDNILLSEIEIIYGPNKELNITQIDAKESFYFFKISVGENATILDYSIIVTDINNNSRIVERRVPVYDNDRPIISDHSSQLNDKFEFKFELDDNIGIKKAVVFYRFDNGSSFNIDLSPNDEGYYTKQIIIPDGSVILYYNVSVTDLSNNSITVPEQVVELEIFDDDIIDIDNPDDNDFLWLYLLIILIIIMIIIFGYIYYKKRENKSDSITEDENDNTNEE